MRDEDTLRFYAREAAAYAAGARQAQASRLAGFLARLAPGASILELGCGGGIDAAAMARLGFGVDATDGSPEMAAQAALRLGRPARVMAFDELDADAAYDSVWANACLLHVPRAGLPGVLARIHRALRPGGLFYAGYKAGGGEGRDGLGRYYNYPDRPALEAAYAEAGPWAELVLEEGSGRGYDGVETPWLHAWARKPV
jgi:SAM-dependent methyltransferase